VYYSYESISYYGEFDVLMNRQLEGKVDVVIFPEKNRAAMELSRSRFGDAPIVILLNCPSRSSKPPLPREARNGRFLYAGRIDPVETLASHYYNPALRSLQIDLYGPITIDSKAERETFCNSLPETVRYYGRLESRELAGLRRHYSYSLVRWN